MSSEKCNVSPEGDPVSEKQAEDEAVEMVYDEVIRDEKGLIERDGFKMKGVNYGPEFEQENLNKAFKTAVVGVVVMIVLFAIALYFFWQLFKSFSGN